MGLLLLLVTAVGAFVFESAVSPVTGAVALCLLAIGLVDLRWRVIDRIFTSRSMTDAITSIFLFSVALAVGLYGWRALRDHDAQHGRAALIAAGLMLFAAGLNTAILVAARLERTRGSGGRVSAWLLKYRRGR